ncbi:MAG: putative metal-binding motif-containing protein [Patescibacteria group bacterium]
MANHSNGPYTIVLLSMLCIGISLGVGTWILKCQDQNPQREMTILTCYGDDDRDGFGAGERYDLVVPLAFSFECPSGYANNNGDCNDRERDVHPGAEEVCNLPENLDDNCDGTVTVTCKIERCYRDRDSDGVGAGAEFETVFGVCPFGYAPTNDDCDDHNNDIRPRIVELCNDVDNNCNGKSDAEDGLVCHSVTCYGDNGEQIDCGHRTTTVTARLNTSRAFVLTGNDTNGITCPTQPIVIDGTSTTAVAGSACTVDADNITVTCVGVPIGVPWAIRTCYSHGGTVYTMHTAHIYGEDCVVSTTGYSDFASITASNNSPIASSTASGVCRNAAL